MEHRPLGLAQLAEEAGMSLIEMAIGFVLRHPGITAAIIGPRTMEQLESQLPATEVNLPDDVLDRIDRIVPPGAEPQPCRRRLGQPRPGGERAPAVGNRLACARWRST